jgi:hypothetical protein
MEPSCFTPPILKFHHIPIMCGGRQQAMYHHLLGLMSVASSAIKEHRMQIGSESFQRPSQ